MVHTMFGGERESITKDDPSEERSLCSLVSSEPKLPSLFLSCHWIILNNVSIPKFFTGLGLNSTWKALSLFSLVSS